MMSESAPDQGDAGMSNTGENKESSVECPTCGKGDFKNELGLKMHHARQHGESITGVEVECAYCGEPKRVPECRLKTRDKFYCSTKGCQAKDLNKASENPEYECRGCGRGYSSRTGVTDHMKQCCPDELYECPTCGTLCLTEQGMRKHHTHQHGERLTKVEFECEWCGEIDTKRWDHIERNKYSYCSERCRWDHFTERYKGEKSHQWRGGYEYYGHNWNEQSKKARERDVHLCQSCGVHQDELSIALDVHHITPLRDCETYEEANRLENLVSLCRKCHKRWEGVPIAPRLISN